MDLCVLCKYMEGIIAPPQVHGMDLCTLSKGVEKKSVRTLQVHRMDLSTLC